MPSRTKDRMISFRVSKTDYDHIQYLIEESGLTKQSYLTRSSLHSRVSTSAEISELKKLNEMMADVDRQLRGIGTNLNQMAHVANISGYVPDKTKLDSISEDLKCFRKDSGDVWRSIRSLIGEQKVNPG